MKDTISIPFDRKGECEKDLLKALIEGVIYKLTRAKIHIDEDCALAQIYDDLRDAFRHQTDLLDFFGIISKAAYTGEEYISLERDFRQKILTIAAYGLTLRKQNSATYAKSRQIAGGYYIVRDDTILEKSTTEAHKRFLTPNDQNNQHNI